MTRPGDRPRRPQVDVHRVDEGEDDDGAGGTNMREPRRPKPRPTLGGGAMELPLTQEELVLV